LLKKLFSLFAKKTPPTKPQAPKKKPARPKVESTRIGELGEHKINIQLDQLPKDCRHLHDLLLPNPRSRTKYSQVDHVLITPQGIFVIETKNYNGEIKGGRSDRYWTVKAAGRRYRLYNPLMQNGGHIKAIEALLADFPGLRYISIVSFTMRCRFAIDPELRKIQSDELIVYDVELSEFIQRKLLRLKTEAAPALSGEDVERIYEALRSANIVDPAAREQHVARLRGKLDE
jgi:hypothetical protein